MKTIILKIVLAFAILSIGIVLPLGCGKDGPTGGGGNVDSLRVTIMSPADGAVVSGPTPLQAQVTGSAGNVKVKFIIDAVQVSVDSVAPWEYSWDPTPLQNGSSHTFRAIVSDNSGNADTTGIRTYVANYAKLTMTVQSPTNGTAIQFGQAFAATVAGGAGGTVIDFKVDDVIVFSDSVAPFQYSWDPSALPSGSAHTVQLIASDTAGQTAASTVRTVYARFAPLVISMPFPPNNAVLGETRNFDVTTSGGSASFHVKYLLDGLLAIEDSIAPYSLAWNPTLVPLGSSHTLLVICTDSSGQADTTSQRQVWALWRPIVTSSGATLPHNVRRILGRSTDTWLELRVEYDSDWPDYTNRALGIDFAFYFDIDQSNSTGATTAFAGTQTIGDIGADYRCMFGSHGDSSSVWGGASWNTSAFDGNFKIASPSNFFEFGVLWSNLGNSDAIDIAAINVHFLDNFTYDPEWIPSSGHVTLDVDQKYYGPLIVP